MLGFLIACVREAPVRYLEMKAATTGYQAVFGDSYSCIQGTPLKQGTNSQTQDLKDELPRIKS